VLGVGTSHTREREDELKALFPSSITWPSRNCSAGPLLTEFSRSLTRLRVQQYQRFFSDADRVLILLHNDPDPDAMASGLALRTVLHRNRQTAVIAALQGVTRPENLRMMNLLDITSRSSRSNRSRRSIGSRWWTCSRTTSGGAIDSVGLVIDHHPEQPGYTAIYKDIRVDYGSTSTILTEHLRAVDMNISERVATAMLYAIKSDTLFFNRQANRVDIEAFSYLYPLADADAHPQDGRRGNHDRPSRVRRERPSNRA
jgi:nanoRNase/pAp phosphatase (c-di-AMP/oligoRNAs hydrolase)